MKLSVVEIILIICIFLLMFFLYQTNEKLEYAEDTVRLQDEAIRKQQKLIDFQIYYIDSINSDRLHSQPKTPQVFPI
jgi:hypothetical protein